MLIDVAGDKGVLIEAVRKNPHDGSVRLAIEVIDIAVAADFDKDDHFLSDRIDRIGAYIAQNTERYRSEVFALAVSNIG